MTDEIISNWQSVRWLKLMREIEHEIHPLAQEAVRETRPQVDWTGAYQRRKVLEQQLEAVGNIA
jgi:hypothetical protein